MSDPLTRLPAWKETAQQHPAWQFVNKAYRNDRQLPEIHCNATAHSHVSCHTVCQRPFLRSCKQVTIHLSHNSVFGTPIFLGVTASTWKYTCSSYSPLSRWMDNNLVSWQRHECPRHLQLKWHVHAHPPPLCSWNSIIKNVGIYKSAQGLHTIPLSRIGVLASQSLLAFRSKLHMVPWKPWKMERKLWTITWCSFLWKHEYSIHF
jgi:hypothetical protein